MSNEKVVQDILEFNKEFRLAAYRETYFNFRHFDNLRWRVPGIAFLAGGALLTFAPHGKSGLPIPAVFAAYGLFTLLCAYLMYRIGRSLKKNNDVLRRYALSFGDDSIPPMAGLKSAAGWVNTFLFVMGVISLWLAVFPPVWLVGSSLGLTEAW